MTNKTEIENLLETYFKQVQHDCKVTMVGRIAMISIVYTDYKPKRVVRREIEDMIPMCDIELQRMYSDDVLKKELYRLMNEDAVVVDEDEHGKRMVSLMTLCEENLYNVSILS